MQFDLFTADRSHGADVTTHIAWHEGLQLLPQHFQAWDARLGGLLHRQMVSASPYLWGIDRLKVDEQALARGILRLSEVTGCFPDGLVFAWDSLRDGFLEYPLETGSEPVRYALAVPLEDFTEKGASVGRYRQFVSLPLADQTNRDEKAVIVRLRPNLSIRRWDPLNSLYVQIPFLEVIETTTSFSVTGFHPSAVRLVPESLCCAEVAGLIRLLRSKATQLGTLPVPQLLTSEYRVGLGWILSSLVAGLPRLEVQIAGEMTHPNDIFLSLCAVAGTVAPLIGRAPDYFPAYDHRDPALSISTVVRFVTGVVNRIGMDPSGWKESPFTFSDGEWSGLIPANKKQSELLILVGFDFGTSEAAVSSWLQHALICFADEKSRCREARVRGLSRRVQSVPEAGLISNVGEWYVRVDVRDASDAMERELVIVGADERSGLLLTKVSLMKMSA